jgi:hypothetical protein
VNSAVWEKLCSDPFTSAKNGTLWLTFEGGICSAEACRRGSAPHFSYKQVAAGRESRKPSLAHLLMGVNLQYGGHVTEGGKRRRHERATRRPRGQRSSGAGPTIKLKRPPRKQVTLT